MLRRCLISTPFSLWWNECSITSTHVLSLLLHSFHYISPRLTELRASPTSGLRANTGLPKTCAQQRLAVIPHTTRPVLALGPSRVNITQSFTLLHTPHHCTPQPAHIHLTPLLVNKPYKCYSAFHIQPFHSLLLGWSMTPGSSSFLSCVSLFSQNNDIVR